MDWQKEDLKYIWHPCSQMKDYETLPPIVIEKGEGIALEDEVVVPCQIDGEFVVDVPGQSVVDHAGIDADDRSVTKRGDLYFFVSGIHGAKIGIL